MIADSDTLKRIRAQADARAAKYTALPADVESYQRALRQAYLAGADAGYTAAKAEERKF